jgi:riboflavin kinase/FMN adenylyltransferase
MFKHMKQMTLIKNDFSILSAPKGTALLIGNFEGVHKGHQSLIKHLITVAKSKNLTPVVYTFYPHPSLFFAQTGVDKFKPKTKPLSKRLMCLEQKISKLAKLGIEVVVVKPFNSQLANMTYQEFLKHLCQDMNMKYLMMGEDFAFGKNRLGTASAIKAWSGKSDIDKACIDNDATDVTVEIMADVKGSVKSHVYDDNNRYASSSIRQFLAEGEVKKAGFALGTPFTLKTYLYEDDYCNLVAHLKGYSPIKKGVYFAKVQYTKANLSGEVGYESAIVPVTITENKAVIAPLAEMPDLIEGRVYLSLIDKIEK